MKCLKCNARIKKDDIFCPECGINLKNKENIFYKLCKKIVEFKKIIFACIILIVILISTYNFCSWITSPKYLADKYLKAVMNNDYNKIYELAGFNNSDIVNKKILKEKIQKMKYDEYKYVDTIFENDYVYVYYAYTKNNKKYNIYVQLTKALNKTLFIFDKYNILSSKVANDVTITVPTNSKILLDDIDIKNYKTKGKVYDTYNFDEMIAGTYKVKITLPNKTIVEDEIAIETNGNYSLSNFKIEENLDENLKSQLKDSLNKMYDNAINNIDYNETGLDNLKEEYKELKSYIMLNNENLISVSFNDITLETANYNKNLIIEYNVECNYQIDETKKTGYINILVEYEYKNDKYTIIKIENLPKKFR